MLFETFAEAEKVTNVEANRLRSIFGPFPASTVTRACVLVNQMVTWLPDRVLDSLKSLSGTGDASADEAKEFGSNMRVVGIAMAKPEEEDEIDWLITTDDDRPPIEEQFDMR